MKATTSSGSSTRCRRRSGPTRRYSKQLFFNVLENSVVHTPPGTRVRVRAGLQNGALLASIEDDGPGIRAGERERVFERFYQSAGPGGRRSGSGLGLSIARGFAEAIGGTMQARPPAAGVGTRIDIAIPLAETTNDKEFLLVDDEPSIQRVLGPVLSADGWTVFPAHSAAEALQWSEREALDVVLLDLGLPDADGKDIISALRGNDKVAIIILSARHQEAEKVLALDAGADDYVDKPFSIEELRARIRAAGRRTLTGGAEARLYQAGDLMLDAGARNVTLQGEPIKLSPKEFELLRELISHAGQVVTHKRLLITGWGDPSVDQQYLRGYVALLRQKLEEDPSEPYLIQSEPGVGYRLMLREPSAPGCIGFP